MNIFVTYIVPFMVVCLFIFLVYDGAWYIARLLCYTFDKKARKAYQEVLRNSWTCIERRPTRFDTEQKRALAEDWESNDECPYYIIVWALVGGETKFGIFEKDTHECVFSQIYKLRTKILLEHLKKYE